MIVRPAAPVGMVLLVLGLAGCGSGSAGGDKGAGAQVVVGLTTDMAVGFAFHRLETTVAVDGAVVHEEDLSYGKGDLALPEEIFLEPAADGAAIELSIEAFQDGDEAPVVTRKASSRAAAGRTLLLPVSLDEACSGVSCASGATCKMGECVAPFIAPDALLDHDPDWLTSAPDACKRPPSGPPSIAIGQGQSAFAALKDGAEVPIEMGPQGGHHAWLALRVSGLRQMGSRLTVGGAFPDLAVELHPTISLITLRKAEAGLCESYGIRVIVDHGLSVEAIRGQKLDVAISLEDSDGDVAKAMKRIVIAP